MLVHRCLFVLKDVENDMCIEMYIDYCKIKRIPDIFVFFVCLFVSLL